MRTPIMQGNKTPRAFLRATLIALVALPSLLAATETRGETKKPAAQAAESANGRSLLTGAAKYDKAGVAANDFCQCTDVNVDAALRIEQVLAKPLSSSGLDFADTALNEVVNRVAVETELPFMIDKQALEEAGVGTDAPVTTTIRNVSVRSALRLLLKQLGLTYVIENEVVLITTNEAAEKSLRTCVYDVRSITSEREEKPTDVLIKTIQSCVARNSWAATGRGDAEISAVKPGVLVITQTQAVHEQVHDLLAVIKRLTQNRPIESKTTFTPRAKNRNHQSAASFATQLTSDTELKNNGPSSSDDQDLFR